MTHPHLSILYRDDQLVAVDKPTGLHVHPTRLSVGEADCMKMLRNQLRQWVFPVHRLDRAASGVLLFALHPRMARELINLFSSRQVRKRYLTVVRGFIEEKGRIDYPLREEKGRSAAPAITEYRRLATVELPVALGKFPTVRYSLAEVFPLTGRRNQIRKHFAHLSHPVIGDVRFGDGKHNRLFRRQWGIHRLLLLAQQLTFLHPLTGEELHITAPVPGEFTTLFGLPKDVFRPR